MSNISLCVEAPGCLIECLQVLHHACHENMFRHLYIGIYELNYLMMNLQCCCLMVLDPVNEMVAEENSTVIIPGMVPALAQNSQWNHGYTGVLLLVISFCVMGNN